MMINLDQLFHEIVGDFSTPGYNPIETVPQFYAEARKLTMKPEDWLAMDETTWGMLFDCNCCDDDILAFLDKENMSPYLWKKLLHCRPDKIDDSEFDEDIFDDDEAIDEIRYNPIQAQYYDMNKLFPPEKRSPAMFEDWDTEEIIGLAYYSDDPIRDYLLENRIKLQDSHLKNLSVGDWEKLIWCNVDFLFHKYCPLDDPDEFCGSWDDVAESFAIKHPDWREMNVKESLWQKIEKFCPDIRKSLAEQQAGREID